MFVNKLSQVFNHYRNILAATKPSQFFQNLWTEKKLHTKVIMMLWGQEGTLWCPKERQNQMLCNPAGSYPEDMVRTTQSMPPGIVFYWAAWAQSQWSLFFFPSILGLSSVTFWGSWHSLHEWSVSYNSSFCSVASCPAEAIQDQVI